MFANDMPADEMRSYLIDWSSIVAPISKLIVLTVADPARHYSCFVQVTRGAEWIEKVGAYTANTPIALRMGWTGLDGLARFWAAYQEVCIELLPSLPFPVCQTVGWPENRAFDEDEALTFLVG